MSCKMSVLSRVILSSEVQLSCTQHSLASEAEEIMGLLIGRVDRERGIVEVERTLVLERLDKRKDRVEIDETQLVEAFSLLDVLNEQNPPGVGKSPLAVVGWYHSHPHITPFPSHVDVETQKNWEVQDPLWVGLIFSCFNGGSMGKLSILAFQSPCSENILPIPMQIKGAGDHKFYPSTSKSTGYLQTKIDHYPSPIKRRVVINACGNTGGRTDESMFRRIPIKIGGKSFGRCCPENTALQAFDSLVSQLYNEWQKSYLYKNRNDFPGSYGDSYNACVASCSLQKLLGRLLLPLTSACKLKLTKTVGVVACDACMICLEEVLIDDESHYVVCQGCHKTFHSTCVKTWIEHSSSCPSCRRYFLIGRPGVLDLDRPTNVIDTSESDNESIVFHVLVTLVDVGRGRRMH